MDIHFLSEVNVPQRIPEAAFALFDGVNLAHVATLMPDGSPQVSPVWVERDGDHTVVLNTARGRVKADNLARDPRVALSIHDQDNLYSYVGVRGTVELVDDPAHEHIDRLSNAYTGRDYPALPPGEQRVTVRVTPTAVTFRPPA